MLVLAGILVHDNEAAFSGARFVPICSSRYRPEMCARAQFPGRRPVLLQMMLWSVTHNPHTTAPSELIAELNRDLQQAARAIRQKGGLA